MDNYNFLKSYRKWKKRISKVELGFKKYLSAYFRRRQSIRELGNIGNEMEEIEDETKDGR